VHLASANGRHAVLEDVLATGVSLALPKVSANDVDQLVSSHIAEALRGITPFALAMQGYERQALVPGQELCPDALMVIAVLMRQDHKSQQDRQNRAHVAGPAAYPALRQ
jgi:hypothetical protein